MDKESFVNICNNLEKNSQFLSLRDFNKIQSEGKNRKR